MDNLTFTRLTGLRTHLDSVSYEQALALYPTKARKLRDAFDLIQDYVPADPIDVTGLSTISFVKQYAGSDKPYQYDAYRLESGHWVFKEGVNADHPMTDNQLTNFMYRAHTEPRVLLSS